ncbi:MAG: hypothetical protein M0Z29_07320 [Actinomycetota bacterium]|nr:hypothetical protein [Actinomycetota bacterium]
MTRRRRGSFGARYGRWDGSQEFDLDADEVFSSIAESLLYHGDPSAALREFMARGLTREDGSDILGLREILERVRRRRREILDRFDPSGQAREIDEELRRIVDTEREALYAFLDAASSSGDSERIKAADDLYLANQLELDSLPASIPGRMSALGEYPFVSPEAKQAYDQLAESLRSQFTENFFNQARDALSSMGPEELREQREMLADLNSLLEAHQRGDDTTDQFREFMQKHPGYFPSDISSTEELLQYLAERMAAASLAFGALSEEQQAELAQLASSVFSDVDLSWQMSRLMNSLSGLVDPRSLARMGFRGNEAMSTQDAADALAGLGELDSTESFLRAVTDPSDLGRLDLERLSELLGQQEAKSLQRLAEVARELEEAGLISREGERLTLSAKGLRRIGETMLAEVFAKLDAGRFGAHARMRSGEGVDKDFETRPYEFGDPLDLALPETLRNTIVRQRGGVPLKVAVEDFEIETREALVAASTVLCLDLSLSMPLRDNFMAAKKVAVALQGLISSRYPRDFLAVVGFSEVAHQIRAAELPSVSWDYAYGTNMEDALRLSRKLLAGKPGKRQVLMITDGEPTAHILENGEPFFSYPPVPETITATLSEVRRCTREGITVNSFVLDANEYLRDFMSRVARINRGRVFYTDPDALGAFVLVDFMDTHL